ncbi:proline-rich protein 36-like [Penaeus monodon]|uniref:proline-rich protein 36-like n=1 Tax=Penaeus monodon TaxID=6687 RepID=UPI0018A729D1|nr:proline-rich protein 36-like [Penaeus monodon]
MCQLFWEMQADQHHKMDTSGETLSNPERPPGPEYPGPRTTQKPSGQSGIRSKRGQGSYPTLTDGHLSSKPTHQACLFLRAGVPSDHTDAKITATTVCRNRNPVPPFGSAEPAAEAAVPPSASAAAETACPTASRSRNRSASSASAARNRSASFTLPSRNRSASFSVAAAQPSASFSAPSRNRSAPFALPTRNRMPPFGLRRTNRSASFSVCRPENPRALLQVSRSPQRSAPFQRLPRAAAKPQCPLSASPQPPPCLLQRLPQPKTAVPPSRLPRRPQCLFSVSKPPSPFRSAKAAASFSVCRSQTACPLQRLPHRKTQCPLFTLPSRNRRAPQRLPRRNPQAPFSVCRSCSQKPQCLLQLLPHRSRSASFGSAELSRNRIPSFRLPHRAAVPPFTSPRAATAVLLQLCRSEAQASFSVCRAAANPQAPSLLPHPHQAPSAKRPHPNRRPPSRLPHRNRSAPFTSAAAAGGRKCFFQHLLQLQPHAPFARQAENPQCPPFRSADPQPQCLLHVCRAAPPRSAPFSVSRSRSQTACFLQLLPQPSAPLRFCRNRVPPSISAPENRSPLQVSRSAPFSVAAAAAATRSASFSVCRAAAETPQSLLHVCPPQPHAPFSSAERPQPQSSLASAEAACLLHVSRSPTGGFLQRAEPKPKCLLQLCRSRNRSAPFQRCRSCSRNRLLHVAAPEAGASFSVCRANRSAPSGLMNRAATECPLSAFPHRNRSAPFRLPRQAQCLLHVGRRQPHASFSAPMPLQRLPQPQPKPHASFSVSAATVPPYVSPTAAPSASFTSAAAEPQPQSLLQLCRAATASAPFQRLPSRGRPQPQCFLRSLH